MGDIKMADFSGYVTKAGLKCADGRTIMPDAFQHQDKVTVPLVWRHASEDLRHILGHVILENRDDGVYGYAFFNDAPEAKHAKTLVSHGDINSLSIFANQLKERSKQVFHGTIREVSLVLAGANPGALIDQIRIAHSDGFVESLDDEAIITTGLELEVISHEDTEEKAGDKSDPKEEKELPSTDDSSESNEDETDSSDEDAASDAEASEDESDDSDDSDDAVAHEASNELAEVLSTLSEEQQEAVNYVVGRALESNIRGTVEHSDIDADGVTHSTEDNLSDDDSNTEDTLNHQEGSDNMTRNVFDQDSNRAEGAVLSHDQFATIIGDVKKHDGSLKDAILAHADEYGITDINLLFPDAKAMANSPELHARRMEWVSKVLGGTKHTPFAKVKSIVADITADEARAKGYIKGKMKKDEVIQLMKRTTGPTTIYKKQRLDRDDMLDITDMDVVAFLKAEIRLMLEEEIARAILVGDGRSASSEDKIKDPSGSLDGTGIRSILHDDDFYAVKQTLDANVAPKDAVKGIVRARAKYRGTGKPTLFISDNFLTDIMLEEDKFGRALYETEQSLQDKLRVKEIVTVDLFDEHEDLFAIMVNLNDYSIGANKGGELTSFEDFDIDYNQHKYLQETRLSGGLTKPFSAVVILRSEGTLAAPAAPSFNGATNTITIPSVTGVVYQIDEVGVVGDEVITEDTEVVAVPDEGYYFAPNSTRTWFYTYTAV